MHHYAPLLYTSPGSIRLRRQAPSPGGAEPIPAGEGHPPAPAQGQGQGHDPGHGQGNNPGLGQQDRHPHHDPQGNPWGAPKGKINPADVSCLNFTRSVPFCEGVFGQVREQMNTLTSFVDASNVYGFVCTYLPVTWVFASHVNAGQLQRSPVLSGRAREACYCLPSRPQGLNCCPCYLARRRPWSSLAAMSGPGRTSV